MRFLMTMLCSLAALGVARAGVTSFGVLPSATDPGITNFDQPHSVYLNREIVVEHQAGLAQDRHELYVFIPGTHPPGTPRTASHGPVAFCELAANLGYHVVSLTYPNDIAASICRNDRDPGEFENFRLAIIQGGASKYIKVSRADSIENRLIKLLQRLQEGRPRENWAQFLNPNATLKWEAIAVGGHSQGGGHAALIGIKHRVARVISTGAPKDYNHRLNAPAAYYREASATPKSCFFAFNHWQDWTGDTSPKQLLENFHALGLDAFGAPAEVDTEPAPYHHTRILMTHFPAVTVKGPQDDGSLTAHHSMLNPQNAERWKPVWTYLLTEKP